MIHFTADQHFGHSNIIQYCNRPFSNVEEMDSVIVDRWNNAVADDDLVYAIGDFCLGNITMAAKYFRMLAGNICIVTPSTHHDRRWIADVYDPFATFPTLTGTAYVSTSPVVTIQITDKNYTNRVPRKIVVYHFPIAVWEDKHYGSWHVHGHVHVEYTPGLFSMNVGVDLNDYTPVSLDGLMDHMEKKGWTSTWSEFGPRN